MWRRLRQRRPGILKPDSPGVFYLGEVVLNDTISGKIVSMEQAVSDYERRLIENALGTTRGNRTQAARLLNITPRIINYKIRKYSIDCSRFR